MEASSSPDDREVLQEQGTFDRFALRCSKHKHVRVTYVAPCTELARNGGLNAMSTYNQKVIERKEAELRE